jgi:hypothetical protein
MLFLFIVPWKQVFSKVNKGMGIVSRYKNITESVISRAEGGILFVLYVGYILLLFK